MTVSGQRWLYGLVLGVAACAQPIRTTVAPATPTLPEPTPKSAPLPCVENDNTQHAGPWQVAGQGYWAHLTWQPPADTACLIMWAGNVQLPRVVAHGSIGAGYSDRYGEWYAPTLQSTPITLTGQPPFIVTARAAQGSGGGDWYDVWQPLHGQWVTVLGFVLEEYANINSVSNTPCPWGEAVFRQVDNEVEVVTCFDGVMQPPQRYRFDAGRFRLVGSSTPAGSGAGPAVVWPGGRLWLSHSGRGSCQRSLENPGTTRS